MVGVWSIRTKLSRGTGQSQAVLYVRSEAMMFLLRDLVFGASRGCDDVIDSF